MPEAGSLMVEILPCGFYIPMGSHQQSGMVEECQGSEHNFAALYGDPKKMVFWEKCSVDCLHEWAFGMIYVLSVSKD